MEAGTLWFGDRSIATGIESGGSKVVYTCGPHAMIEALPTPTENLTLRAGVSEEYMACSIGICIGCVVRVENAEGKTDALPANLRRRTVFDARNLLRVLAWIYQ